MIMRVKMKILYTVIARVETRSDISTLNDVIRSLERQSLPITDVVIILCTAPNIAKAVVKFALRCVPKNYNVLRTPFSETKVMSPVALCILSLHSRKDDGHSISDTWVVPVMNMVICGRHHECLHAAISNEMELGDDRRLAVAFSSSRNEMTSDVGFCAFACEAVTLFAKKAETAVFAMHSHHALRRFLCAATSKQFGTGVAIIETPGAAARPLRVRNALDADEFAKRVCTTVIDNLPEISQCFSLGVINDLVHQVARSMDLHVATLFAPDTAIFVTKDDHHSIHDALRKTGIELDRICGGKLDPLFTTLVATAFGIERFCRMYGMQGACDDTFRRSLLEKHKRLRTLMQERTPAADVAWDCE